MLALKKFFTSIFLATAYVSTTSAFAVPSESKHATHRTRHVGRGLKMETFHPASSYQTFGGGMDHPLSKHADTDLEGATVSFVASHLKIDFGTIKFRTGYSGETSKHAYVSQVHDGIPFANAVANIAYNHDNKIVAFGSSFVKPKSIAPSKPSVSLKAAIATAEGLLDGKFNNHPATLEYLVKEDGSVALTHVAQIQNENTGSWYQAFVDAQSGELISIVDFVAEVQYLVLPITKENPTQGFEILDNPQDDLGSPGGWHDYPPLGNKLGNNAKAYKFPSFLPPPGILGTTSQSSTEAFIYPQSALNSPSTLANVHAACVNAFYIVGVMHDISYRYGFDEAAYNFQTDNFGKGGKQNDRVFVSVQDISGINNANFATPPDGVPGQMRMFLWDFTSPNRDGALENSIIVHEYTHGITNRMTGGGTGKCLQTTEAGGMGEGWSDAMAEWTEQTSDAVADYVLGQYVLNDPKGIRSYPYSTSKLTNPLRYSNLKTRKEVHEIGEVWANMLHNVYAALVLSHGWSGTAPTNPDGTEGNIVFLHLFIDALSVQPCNPTFVQARDAIIQADANRYKGANRCLLWAAFASRGLGVNARDYNDDEASPSDC
ncbi:Fungalysin metallopeptidase-domain-containing protein [Lyophyllum atratum]|nr:Fungalysin metallopeptidase-domain-containing protein [Lyophyllum atratum]